MSDSHSRVPAIQWLALPVALAGLVALYANALRAPFLNDDFLFLEESRQRTLGSALTGLDALGNYYRPLSRQIYFALLEPLAHGNPLLFHAVNFALFVGALALVADLLAAFLPRAGVMAGTLYFALLPFQRVNLTWISCSQDLLALLGTLGAVALYRRGRTLPALLAFAVAITSKESALGLPLALLAWERVVSRIAWAKALRRVAPFAVLAGAWTVLELTMRAHHGTRIPLEFTPDAFLAGFAHLVQSILGLDHPAGFFAALVANGPSVLALMLFGALAWWYAPAVSGIAPGTDRRTLIGFAVAWLLAFAIPLGPVSPSWSSYYYTLAAVGAALLVGLAFARGDRWTWLALSAGLLWWHAGGAGVRAFSFDVIESKWTWTSHLTPFYFNRAAALTDSLGRGLRRIEPNPTSGTRFYFATLPSWAGFQMGNGAQIRAVYRDPTLASYFYSQFSDSTAGTHPCHFLFWDGRELVPLYEREHDPWFQVGSDLMLLGRPRGARDAFRRGLAAGGNRMDLLYWLGWAELFNGRRDAAEQAWKAFGATDDSLVWHAHLRAAHNAIVAGDTLDARRQLVTAIAYGIGRPEAHAVLGPLILADPKPVLTKYGLMELQVTTWLNPRDWDARRSLALGLAHVRLEDAARHELTTLRRDFPAMVRDTAVARAWARYGGDRAKVFEAAGGR